jgi:hypothetical protein
MGMDTNSFDKNRLALLQGRVACKMAEIHQMLAPGVALPIAPEELQARADRHMASLPPAEQEKLRMKALVAYAELERLSAEMAIQLDYLTDEMNKAARNRRAAVAYRHASGAAGGQLARM